MKLCALLDKQSERKVMLHPDYFGFLLDESFVAIISTQTVSVVTQSTVSGVAHSMHEAVIWTDAWKA